MRLGIIGAGRLARALGRRWAERGHQVYFGCRDPRSPEVAALLQDVGHGAQALDPHDAAGADVVLLAVPGAVAPALTASLGDLEGRILLDCSNPASPSDPSVVDAVVDSAVGARVVKTLNTVDAEVLARPDLADVRPVMPLCADESEARHTVSGLVYELGLAPVDCGPLANAHLLEAMAHLRATLSAAGRGPDLAFSLIQIDAALEQHQVGRRQTRIARPRVQ